MQLRQKFFIAISLLTTVPLLILQFGVVERMEQEVRLRTEHEINASLDKMAGELKLILNNQKSIANGLSRVPAVRHFANSVVPNQKTGIYIPRSCSLLMYSISDQSLVQKSWFIAP